MQPSPSEVRDVLVRALDLLGPEGEHWTRGVLARDADGRAVEAWLAGATCWCMSGAVIKGSMACDDDDERERLIDAAIYSLEQWVPGRDVPAFNDRFSTHFPHVRSAFERAIASLSDPEGSAAQ